MNQASQLRRAVMFATTAFCAIGLGSAALAQAPADGGVEEIIVVGSQIKGSKVTAALPVTVLGTEQIQAAAAGSGDELFRTIPQMGNVTFNSAFLPGSSNSARGDVNSISLRNLGPGNTLVLINGRRAVAHPTTQADANNVPTFTYNSNAIPVAGLKSLEVLRDGAAAIYGADAVAGVINTVLQDNYEGGQMEAQYGTATGTSLREGRLTGVWGKNFNDSRGNFTIFGSMEKRSALLSSDQSFTSSSDKRTLFAGTEFENTVGLDGRSASTPFGAFQAVGVTSAIRQGTTAITGATGIFHYSPQSVSCTTVVSAGLCIVPGAFNTTTDRVFRVDNGALYKSSIIPQADRFNLFATAHYDLTDDVTFFSEAGWYHARTENLLASGQGVSTSPAITIGANAYYNPFGATTLANGQPNPNRLPNLVGVPASGLNLTFNSYGLLDLGNSQVTVTNDQYRLLGGLRGKKFGFNWESAALYSMAKVHDLSYALDGMAFARAVNLTTPDAYNPFNGSGTTNFTTGGDMTPSSAAALNSIITPIVRENKTTLALWDFKVNRPDLLAIWAGDIGIAAGVEVRHETYKDNRDKNIDGTLNYTDPVTGQTSTGIVTLSNIPGTSVSPDVSGKRTVMSAYAELAVPLVSPEMGIPLVNKLELQLAGRAEDYSDVGSIAKPKVAGAWDIVPGVRLRGSWSQGFRAPNLEVINVTQVSRTNGRQDYYYCEADLRNRRITAFTACTQSRTTRAVRKGNPDLKPETSESLSYGLVLQPNFIPSEFGRFTFTADIWKIKQKGVIGLFGEGNAVILDYLLRLQGSSNPAVHRLAPTPDNIAVFAGSGLAPVGFVDYVDDQYINQLPTVTQGIDFGGNYRLNTDTYGDFVLDVNVSKMDKLYQSPTQGLASLIAARDAGQINAGTIITGGAELVGQNGTPEWRGSGSMTWRMGGFAATWMANYTGKYYDTGLTYAAGGFYNVPSTVTHNLSAGYTFDEGKLAGTRFLIGARNVFDKKPPLVPGGYSASVYNPYAQYVYFNVRKSF